MAYEEYRGRAGKRRGRIDSRSRIAREAGVRGAEFDTWGNLVRGRHAEPGIAGGQYVDEGDEYVAQGGPTNIDIFKAGKLTPRINAFKRQFDRPVMRGQSAGQFYSEPATESGQMTSWGKSWSDALAAAREQDNIRSRHQEQAMNNYRGFKRAVARRKIRSAPYSGSYRD